MTDLKAIIEEAYQNKGNFTTDTVPKKIHQAIHQTIELLDNGELRIAEKKNGQWNTNEWAKMAILLYFKTEPLKTFDAGYTFFYDKIPLKYSNNASQPQSGVRVVPHAIVRKGAYLAPNTVLMPSYINIGTYVDSGTLIDTWATVGSCAQIGKNVHLSGGAGIGGVLEPLQAHPTIIEDDCFIGARSEIVEGVIVEKGSVISMGVFISQSTPIYNRQTQEITYGRIPAGSVVIPGSLPSKDGHYNRYSAIIVKQVDEKTRSKVSLNELLREK
ncbi:2,3,4,5-tetrahydropyridine-2,6-dicarboxylate N-succinyltransferase [Coxiella endosymbiont of Ornithodoros amblus]|uniref:2,3,4,5-tetrahydropyridine-2,6-dicarboxylate N-succinyltransferase n=1 Tax=Coxiella endosymbiont of Ornithodoros amblus TaxID=1656166 RepID=UPI00244E01B8|nr:2,3,4,5-tetrahydropyridine-2,6-dicarboxylate N-succinyltransferase [Coxiella endosymbiont of Ornithodoros amblus]MBW5802284.1 2,3,4,5-tetrahydropyridine-2,6-dicarboxylate N-succinyltransferase [Coxiella endosymbiont of Ornithodoros amblus]